MTRYHLTFELQQELESSVLHREPVTPADLIDALGELWWNAGPRRGAPELSFGDLLGDRGVELRPAFLEGRAPYCSGFTLAAPGSSGASGPCSLAFERHCLEHVARRGARGLLQDGVLRPQDTFYYFLRADPEGGTSDGSPHSLGTPLADLAAATPSIEHLVHPLAPLLERAEVRGPEPDPARHPVFFTAEAVARTEQLARRGAGLSPPVETGCVLVGSLVLCPDTGEMYAVVVDALEATDAASSQFHLDFTARTWARIQTILSVRRKQPETRTHRILGQAHSHPFLPAGGAPPCEHCYEVETCSRTTAVLSTDDHDWCRAVFSGEPWQLSYVFGLDARARNVDTFYSQHRGVLEPRGFHVLPEFPPS